MKERRSTPSGLTRGRGDGLLIPATREREGAQDLPRDPLPITGRAPENSAPGNQGPLARIMIDGPGQAEITALSSRRHAKHRCPPAGDPFEEVAQYRSRSGDLLVKPEHRSDGTSAYCHSGGARAGRHSVALAEATLDKRARHFNSKYIATEL